MANRVLLGDHDTHGYGLYVSPVGGNVAAADNDYFLFDSSAFGAPQLLLWKQVTTTSSHDNSNVTFTYNSGGVRNYAFVFLSHKQNLNESAADFECVQETDGTANTSANYSVFGGKMGGITTEAMSDDWGDNVDINVSLTNSGSTGTCTVNRVGTSNTDLIANVMIFAESA